MRHEMRLAQRSVTHVQGLFLAEQGGDVRLCFALPRLAQKDGRMNFTFPGGRIERRSSRRFESAELAMLREFNQETGGSPEHVQVLCGVGAPVRHYTEKGELKLVQGFAGVVSQLCTAPRPQDEIAAVQWLHQSAWPSAIQTMNRGKQQLALRLMEQAAILSRMPRRIKQELANFLETAKLELI